MLSLLPVTRSTVDVYTFLPIYGRDELPSELIGAQLQFKRLFRDA